MQFFGKTRIPHPRGPDTQRPLIDHRRDLAKSSISHTTKQSERESIGKIPYPLATIYSFLPFGQGGAYQTTASHRVARSASHVTVVARLGWDDECTTVDVVLERVQNSRSDHLAPRDSVAASPDALVGVEDFDAKKNAIIIAAVHCEIDTDGSVVLIAYDHLICGVHRCVCRKELDDVVSSSTL